MENWLRVEFHCHTKYSKDSLTSPKRLVAVCQAKGIDRVIVTDHNSIGGALEAQAIDPQRVIVGEEIMTTQGELLTAYVKEEIPAGLHPMDAIERLRAQGAFISVSHPFDIYRSGGWALANLEKIAPLVDAIETFNARCYSNQFNKQAQEFARQRQLAGTSGSDAHTHFELGRATLRLPPFCDAAGLRIAIRQAQADETLSSPWIHLTSGFAVWAKKLRRLTRPAK